ncbi:MAG: hypothetical protein HY553_07975 [Elusimicrobia bacterium]|nr:hypothetical protein [Elusimicrobiota bacterium]
MDIFTRLRVLLWILVLSLWGTMVYQYLGEDQDPEAQMQWFANPFKDSQPLPSATPEPKPAPFPVQPQPPVESAAPPAAAPQVPAAPPAEEIVALPAPWAMEKPRPLKAAPPPGHFIKPLAPRLPRTAASPAAKPAPQSTQALRRHEQVPVSEAPAVPKGFSFEQLRHFNVYTEGEPAAAEFLETLEKLHANLMLDLAAFSPWAREERVSIFLFRNQDSYRRVTGRPAWSGGASSVSKRKIYLYESEELIGILAHELCHIYFDGFFVGGKTNPLWLSEGLATLVQVERGLASPNWLPENLDVLNRGGGFTFDDLMRVEDTSGANDDNVRLWYTQAYSVVRFLIRAQWKSSFFHFCRHLRDGRPVQEALYRAYGMPFNRVKALEYAWRYDMTSRKLTGLRAARTGP